jgi:hypothetical protein
MFFTYANLDGMMAARELLSKRHKLFGGAMDRRRFIQRTGATSALAADALFSERKAVAQSRGSCPALDSAVIAYDLLARGGFC